MMSPLKHGGLLDADASKRIFFRCYVFVFFFDAEISHFEVMFYLFDLIDVTDFS